MGATGPIYAFRKELFRPVPPTSFADLVIPVRIALAGFRTVHDPEAVGREEAATDIGSDLRRRVRNGARGFRSVALLLREAFRSGGWAVAGQLLSHKILRWLSLPLLGGVFVGSGLATGAALRLIWYLQIPFYAAAALGAVLDRMGIRRNPFQSPYYLVAAQAAIFIGLAIGAFSRGKPYWSPRGA
jgi:hypothetical protein